MIQMKSFEEMSCGEAIVNGESAHETEGGSMPAIYLFIYLLLIERLCGVIVIYAIT